MRALFGLFAKADIVPPPEYPFYRLVETTLEGETITVTRIEVGQVTPYLIHRLGLAKQVAIFAVAVCEKNPGVPYDLCTLDDDKELEWTARFTLVEEIGQ